MNPFRLLTRCVDAITSALSRRRHRRNRLLIVEQRRSNWPRVDDTRDAHQRHWRTVGQKR